MVKLLFVLSITFLTACCVCQKTGTDVKQKPPGSASNSQVGPHTLVYKTKGNYNLLVPILLSDDKKNIISYPDPKDLKLNGELQTPIVLKNNYLLDKRGIGRNVAFLKYTYADYIQLKTIPTIAELMQAIVDKDPLVELIDCGLKSNFQNEEKQINDWIEGNLLRQKGVIVK